MCLVFLKSHMKKWLSTVNKEYLGNCPNWPSCSCLNPPGKSLPVENRWLSSRFQMTVSSVYGNCFAVDTVFVF